MFVPVPPQESKDSKKENMSMSSAPSDELVVVAVAGRDEAHAVIAAQDVFGGAVVTGGSLNASEVAMIGGEVDELVSNVGGGGAAVSGTTDTSIEVVDEAHCRGGAVSVSTGTIVDGGVVVHGTPSVTPGVLGADVTDALLNTTCGVVVLAFLRSWPSSIYNHDCKTILHPSIKSLDLQHGRWIQCRCKVNKLLQTKRPFEIGNFMAHLLTHPSPPSNQMSILSFFSSKPSPTLDQNGANIEQQPRQQEPPSCSLPIPAVRRLLETSSPCQGSLMVPINTDTKRKLVLLSKYGLSATNLIIYRNVCTQEVNLKSVSCTNKFIRRNGRQPNCCPECFEVHEKKIRFKLFKKMVPYDEAEDALRSQRISPIQVKALQSFLQINNRFHNLEGLEFKTRIAHFLTGLTSDLSKDMASSDGSLPGLDLLIKNFSDYYRNNSSFRSSALVGILSALITKITDKGFNNPPWNDKALNLCMLINDQCPKAYGIFMQNVVGVSDRHLRRLRGSCRDVHESVLENGNDKIAARLKMRLDLAMRAMIQQRQQQYDEMAANCGMVSGNDNNICQPTVAYSIAFDGTTVPPVLQACPHAGGIVGMCAPNHIRRPDGDESMKTILPELAKLPKDHLANEAFIAVISFQTPNKIMSPMTLLAVQPQRVNVKSDFIQRVVKIAEASSSGTFLGYSGDGAHATEIRKDQLRFLDGEIDYIAQQDINHAMKNFLGALVGGTQLLTAGGDVVDNGLLRVSGVPKEIWCRKDFACDGLVLKATSHKTMMGVLMTSNEECGSKAILILTLTFMRTFLFAVHGEEVDRKQRVIGIWAAMLFLTSIKNLNPITKRNLMACAVGAVFAAYRADVINMSAIFEEPAEHMFAGMRSFFKMFTIADIPILDEKVQRRMLALVEHGITSQASDKSGGYAAGTHAYAQRNARMVLRQRETEHNKRQRTETSMSPHQHRNHRLSSNVNGGQHIDPSRSAATQIATDLLPILSAVSRGMRCTMSQMGFEEGDLCAFMDPDSFLTMKDFIRLYNLAMNNQGEQLLLKDQDDQGAEPPLLATTNHMLADLFDNLMALEDATDSEDTEASMAAQAEATSNRREEVVDSSSMPAMDLFLNAFLNLNNIPIIHRGDTAMLKLHLAVVGMEACKVSTLGSRERGHVGMEMHYQQLNIRWFGTARRSISSEVPQLDSLRRNVLFQIGDNVYRVLTIYSKTYNKWLEVTSVPMGHLQKSANLYKVHARRIVEDVLSFNSSQRQFIPAENCIELLTTGHAIAAGTILGSLWQKQDPDD